MSENVERGWVKWRSELSSPNDADETLVVGDVPLLVIHRNHRDFDLKNAKGAVLPGCKLYAISEWRISGGEPSHHYCSYVLMALTQDGWRIKVEEDTLLRRSEGSELAEAETMVVEERARHERELAQLEARRRVVDDELTKLEKKRD